jgi:hypothetical protein
MHRRWEYGMKAPHETIKDAIDELAHEAVRRQFRRTITETDALPYCDDATVKAWIAVEANRSSYLGLLAEALEALPDSDLLKLTACLHNDSPTSRTLLLSGVVRNCARDIAYQAEQVADNMEPSDDEAAASYITSGDVIGSDQYAMAREVNAALRVVGAR